MLFALHPRRLVSTTPTATAGLPARSRRIRHVQVPLVVATCALLVTSGCGSRDERSARRVTSVRAVAIPSPDLASRVVKGEELVGLRLVRDDVGEVREDPDDFTANHAELGAQPAEAVTALRRGGFVAGTVKRFEPRQRRGMAESISVQMRDARGATAEAERQFSAAFAPYPGESRCATGIERFDVPRVDGAQAVEIRHRVNGDVFDATTIVFTKGAFVYLLRASGAGIGDRRDELIEAARALFERVPVDHPRGTP